MWICCSEKRYCYVGLSIASSLIFSATNEIYLYAGVGVSLLVVMLLEYLRKRREHVIFDF